MECKNNINNMHAMTDLFRLEISNQMPSARHDNTAKVNTASPHATFPSILVTAYVSLASCANLQAQLMLSMFVLLFPASQCITQLSGWLVSALALTGSDINLYTEWKTFHVPFWNWWNIQELVQDTFDALDFRVSRAKWFIAKPIKSEGMFRSPQGELAKNE